MKIYQLSAGAILYVLFQLHKQSIYGVPNVMPSLQDHEFSAFAQEVEQELMKAGYGILDFDGVFTIESDFSSLLGRCADCQEVIGVSLYQKEVWHKRTIYLGADAILERGEDFNCVLRTAKDPGTGLLGVLALPESSSEQLQEICVDTDLLETKNLKKIMESGCNEIQARLILDSMNGKGGYAHVVHTRDGNRIKEHLFLYNQDGILKAEVEYTETQELLRLTPLTTKETVDLLLSLTAENREEEL